MEDIGEQIYIVNIHVRQTATNMGERIWLEIEGGGGMSVPDS
jgi:hypothetical protein